MCDSGSYKDIMLPITCQVENYAKFGGISAGLDARLRFQTCIFFLSHSYWPLKTKFTVHE